MAILPRSLEDNAINSIKKQFVTFEGIDQAGKSTQIKMLEAKLQQNSITAVLLRDPGSNNISEKIRGILLDLENTAMSPWAELLLYEAARAQMVTQSIEPALQQGKLVLCDRFYDSTTAYQGYGRHLSLDLVHEANKIGACGRIPDLTFYIDIPVSEAIKRRRQNNLPTDRLENEGNAFLDKVRQGYLELAANENNRIKIIDGCDDIENIHDKIWKNLIISLGGEKNNEPKI